MASHGAGLLRLPAASLVLIALVLAALVGAPEARAQVTGGGEAQFFGLVFPNADGLLPVKVRAVGAQGANCGTADVLHSGEGLGFYLLTVASAAEKPGCPALGTEVRFFLLFDQLDPGVPTMPPATEWRPGAHSFSLMPAASPAPNPTFGFAGDLPAAGGLALLAWQGPHQTPAELAVLTIPREVIGMFRFDPGTRRWLAYIPGAPPGISTYTHVAANEVVVVRVR